MVINFVDLESNSSLNVLVSVDDDYSTSVNIIDVYNYQIMLPNNSENCDSWGYIGNNSVCYLDVEFDVVELENLTNYLHNVIFTVGMNNSINTTVTSGIWAFNDFCLNISDTKPTTSPTQQPTFDATCTSHFVFCVFLFFFFFFYLSLFFFFKKVIKPILAQFFLFFVLKMLSAAIQQSQVMI